MNVGIVQFDRLRNHFFAFLVLLTSLPASSHASILGKESIEQMTSEAKEIQIGEVTSTWTSPDPDNKMFYTYVKIKVNQTIKGKQIQELLLKQPGGRWVNPETKKATYQKVFGMESFQKGEKALFFITHAKDGSPMVMFQGKQQIVKDPKTGEENTVREQNARDIELIKNNAIDESNEHSFYATYDQKPLNEMVTQIQRAMNIQKGELSQ